MRVPVLARLAAVLLLALLAGPAAAQGLAGRLLVGYQGWFGCPGDFAGNEAWHHWFHGPAKVANLTVDQLPALDAFEASDLCDTGLERADGAPLRLFSSQNPRIVRQHLAWLREHGVDTVSLQRFVSHAREPRLRERSDNVLRHVRAAAEALGLWFHVAYDVSGAEAATVVDDLRADWARLTGADDVTRSPAYLHDGERPVLLLWGFGFPDRPGEPTEVARLLADLKPAHHVIGGVPAGWRTLAADSRREPAWAGVYRSFDALSPWSVGRFQDDAGADRFRQERLVPDLAETRRLGIGYLPVVFPGFSWRNLMTVRGEPARAILNQVPRRCGRFLQRQVDNALAAGATSLYAAMFDEVDEGTALLPLEPSRAAAPADAQLLPLDADGCVLPPDWYLRLTGDAARRLRSAR